MKIDMQAFVVQAGRYAMDNGVRGGSIFMLSDPEEQSENRTGQEVIKMTAPYEVVDQLRGKLPAECRMKVEVVQGGGNKSSMKVLAIQPAKAAEPSK